MMEPEFKRLPGLLSLAILLTAPENERQVQLTEEDCGQASMECLGLKETFADSAEEESEAEEGGGSNHYLGLEIQYIVEREWMVRMRPQYSLNVYVFVNGYVRLPICST